MPADQSSHRERLPVTSPTVVEIQRLDDWVLYYHRLYFRRLETLTRRMVRLARNQNVSDTDWYEATIMLGYFSQYGAWAFDRVFANIGRMRVNINRLHQRRGELARDDALRRLNNLWDGEYPPNCLCGHCMYSRDVIRRSMIRGWSSERTPDGTAPAVYLELGQIDVAPGRRPRHIVMQEQRMHRVQQMQIRRPRPDHIRQRRMWRLPYIFRPYVANE